jgi:hypothetical protein
MSSRTVKWLILASVLLIAFPVVAGASTSRLAGMGTQGDYIKDYTNIFGYPSCVSGVGNLVYGEFGTVTDYDASSEYYQTDDRAFGAVLGNLFDGKYGTIGFNMREYSPALGTGSQPWVDYYGNDYGLGVGFESLDGYPIDPVDGSSVEAFDLMWGKKFDKLALGLRLNRSSYKYTHTSPEHAETGNGLNDPNIFGFGVGLGYDLSEKATAELGILYQSRTFKDDAYNYYYSGTEGYQIGTFESDGGGAYLASARMLWQWQPNVMVVPVARFYSFNLDDKFTPDDTALETLTNEASVNGWQVGVAGNWTVNEKDLFVAGVTFASNVWDDKTNKYKDTESLMPTMFASLETKLNSWLTLRFGGRKGVFYSYKYEDGNPDPAYENKESWSPFQFFTGAGVKLGTLQFDATLAKDFFHNPATYLTGPNGDSGDGSGYGNYYSPLFPKVTATYTF